MSGYLVWRERFLVENNGIHITAAAEFAVALSKGLDGLPGFSHDACLLAAAEIFPEVTEDQIRRTNHWEVVLTKDG